MKLRKGLNLCNFLLFGFFLFSSCVVFAEGKGGTSTGGTKGNGGGRATLNEAMEVFKKYQRNTFELNFRSSEIQHLDDPKHIDCNYIQGTMVFGFRMMRFLSLWQFKFQNPSGKEVAFPELDVDKILENYIAPNVCVDIRGKGNVDLSQIKAKIIIQDENTFDQRKDLMALNFTTHNGESDEKTGKIFIFANNWISSKVIPDNNACYLELNRRYSNDPQYELAEAMGGIQKNCLYLTHLGVGTHELLSVNGVKEEQENQFTFSSYFVELLTFNDTPSQRSLAFMGAIREYYLWSYETLLGMYKVVLEKQPLLMKLPLKDFNVPRKPDDPKGPNHPDFIAYYRNLKSLWSINRIIDESLGTFTFFTELIKPTGGALATKKYYAQFAKDFFDLDAVIKVGREPSDKFSTFEFLKSLSSEKVVNPQGNLSSFEQTIKTFAYLRTGAMIAATKGWHLISELMDYTEAPDRVRFEILDEMLGRIP